MMTQLVTFVNLGEVDVYLRIDRGHGRVEYEAVAAVVVASPPPREEWRFGSWLPEIVTAILGV